MTEQDKVLFVNGAWVRDRGMKWYFDPDIVDGSGHIQLYEGMTYRDLVVKVREKLALRAHNITIKLSYQFLDWMGIDDGNGSTPQYISDDHEVEVFIQMRRKIEEVNMFVTVVKHVSVASTILHQSVNPHRSSTDSIGDESGEDTDDEWHDFAMSETPLTLPDGTQQASQNQTTEPSRNVARCGGGITIREPAHIIRLASPTCLPGAKGKGVMVSDVASEDSAADGEDDAVVPDVPLQQQSARQSSRSVRRQLFTSLPVRMDGATTNRPIPDTTAERGSGIHRGAELVWSRFQEALYNMLSDVSAEPVLFGRDAPPVFNAVGVDGMKFAYICPLLNLIRVITHICDEVQ